MRPSPLGARSGHFFFNLEPGRGSQTAVYKMPELVPVFLKRSDAFGEVGARRSLHLLLQRLDAPSGCDVVGGIGAVAARHGPQNLEPQYPPTEHIGARIDLDGVARCARWAELFGGRKGCDAWTKGKKV